MPYVGEIRMFAGNFNPSGWTFCNGSLLPISEYETLFILIGTTYGGDGQETFALPDLRGRVPVHQGQGGGGSNYFIGETGGVEQVTLTPQQIPSHTHAMVASTGPGTSSDPKGRVVGSAPAVSVFLRENPTEPMAVSMVTPVGGSQPHDNRLPYLAINYIISLFGVFPSQS